MPNFIKGNYKRTIFRTDKGYVVGLFKVKETNDNIMADFIGKTITFTGFFDQLNENELYAFYGEVVEHPKYGIQYQVKEYERLKPADKDGIIEFLSSDLFPGIGVKMATKIVEKLGENTLDLIIQDPKCLLIVKGLNSQKRQLIYETLINYEDSHKTIVYLTELGFSMRDSLAIYNKYRTNTIMQLESDIYKIIDDIEEISFLKIDEIAKSMNIAFDDEKRVKACIIYIMNNLIFNNGDTYFLIDELYEELFGFVKFKLDIDLLKNYLLELQYEDKIVIKDEKYYLKYMYDTEINICKTLKFLNTKIKTKNKDASIKLQELESLNNIDYDEKQKDAIITSLENNVTIITGGPGTGKTTIVKAIVDLYQMLNDYDNRKMLENVTLLAPTGRASKRLSEATNFPAMTIHRFLKWNKDNNSFGINEYNKDYSKLIIVDEVSMLDINIFNSLLKGLTTDIKLILVGDYNQLPSVGPGQVLKDLIMSNIFPTIYLELLYRQKENSYINSLAYEIKENNLGDFLTTKDDYTFLNCSSSSIKKNLQHLCEQILSKGIDHQEFQIMAPMYYGEVGIDKLNMELQAIFNPPNISKKEIKIGNTIYRENDKVLELVNIPEENIYNGDIGFIKKIIDEQESESKKTEIYIDFYGNIVKFFSKDFNQIRHGYVISIHKSQGSEFPITVVVLSNSHKRMLYRKLIYTAITRAKRKLILIGEEEAFKYAVSNNNEYIRKTTLLDHLIA